MDPSIAYQKCQELQYSQFGSAQGLLYAMRDYYHRMASEKLTDAMMESILWNKVPLELQQELKEIPDGSVKELLQKLLREEMTIQEREQRRKGVNQNRLPRTNTNRDNTSAGALNKMPQRVDSNSATPERSPSQRDARGKVQRCHCGE